MNREEIIRKNLECYIYLREWIGEPLQQSEIQQSRKKVEDAFPTAH